MFYMSTSGTWSIENVTGQLSEWWSTARCARWIFASISTVQTRTWGEVLPQVHNWQVFCFLLLWDLLWGLRSARKTWIHLKNRPKGISIDTWENTTSDWPPDGLCAAHYNIFGAAVQSVLSPLHWTFMQSIVHPFFNEDVMGKMLKILQKNQDKKHSSSSFPFPHPQSSLFHHRKIPSAQSSPNPCWTLPVIFLFLICVEAVSTRVYTHLSSGDGLLFAWYQTMIYDKSCLLFICSYWAHTVSCQDRQVSSWYVQQSSSWLPQTAGAVNRSFSSWNWKTNLSTCSNYEIRQ